MRRNCDLARWRQCTVRGREWRNAGRCAQYVPKLALVQGFADPALGQFVLAHDASGVDPRQHVDTVSRPFGHLRGVDAAVQPGVAEVIGSAGRGEACSVAVRAACAKVRACPRYTERWMALCRWPEPEPISSARTLRRVTPRRAQHRGAAHEAREHRKQVRATALSVCWHSTTQVVKPHHPGQREISPIARANGRHRALDNFCCPCLASPDP
jgi:hypothetical protein